MEIPAWVHAVVIVAVGGLVGAGYRPWWIVLIAYGYGFFFVAAMIMQAQDSRDQRDEYIRREARDDYERELREQKADDE